MTFPLQVTFFQSLEDTHPQLREFSEGEACAYFNPDSPPLFTKEERKVKAERFSFNIYKPGTSRKKENVDLMTGIVLDFDNNKEAVVLIETILEILLGKGLNYLWYTTWSHTEELPRWRLILPFLEPISVSRWKSIHDKMIVLLDNPPGLDHQASRDVTRIWCVPCQQEGNRFESGEYFEGSFLNPHQIDSLFRTDQKEAWTKQCQAIQPVSTVYPLYEPSEVSTSDIKDMLDRISPDCDYYTWLRIGMALHHHFGGADTALNLWIDWSRPATKFKGEHDFKSHWYSFSMKPSGVTIGTLIHYAREKGYERFSQLSIPQKEFSVPTPQDSRQAEEIPFLEEPEDEEEEEDEEEREIEAVLDFSEYAQRDILDLPTPFLKETYTYLLGSASYFNYLYTLSATITLSGFLLRKLVANKRRTESHANFMTMGIGASGTGKTQMLKAVQQILVNLEQDRYYVPSLGTIQGAVETMRQQGGCLFLIQDEASYAFKAMKNKNISIHEMNVEKFKLEMFSNPPFCKAAATKNADMTSIRNPFFCEISFSTPDILQHLSSESYTKGLLPRYLVFQDATAGDVANPNVNSAIPLSLMTILKDYNTAFQINEPTVVFDSDADTLLKKLKETVDERRRLFRKKKDSRQVMVDALLARINEHASKLCLLGAEKRYGSYFITLEAVQWGIAVALHSFKTLLEMMGKGIYENKVEENRARVLEVVQKVSQGDLVPKWKISRNIKYLTAKELQDILIKLHEEGQIEIQMKGKSYMKIRSKKRKGKK